MLFTLFFDPFLHGTFRTPFPSRRFSQIPGKRRVKKGANYIDFFDYFLEPSKRAGTPQSVTENGLFCGTFHVSRSAEFLGKGSKKQ